MVPPVLIDAIGSSLRAYRYVAWNLRGQRHSDKR